MSSRSLALRDLLFLAAGIGGMIVLLLAGALTLGGAFSWLWFARALMLSGLILCIIEVVLLGRLRHVNHVRGPLTSWRRQDRMQGCSLAMLGAVIIVGMLACGGLMDWVLEFR